MHLKTLVPTLILFTCTCLATPCSAAEPARGGASPTAATQPASTSTEETPSGLYQVWVQEEPENMGAWPYLRFRFGDRLLGRWTFESVCRPVSASPATGSPASHKLEQELLLARVFGPDVRK